MNSKRKQNKKGISLIVLVITIIIMIILAGAVILTLVNSGIIGQTKIGIFKNNAANYKAELQTYISNELIKDTSFKADDFSRDSKTIQTYITSMSDTDAARFMIIQGQLAYINDTEDPLFTTEELTALKEVAIKPNEYNYVAKEGNTMTNIDYTGINVYINPKPIIEDTDNFYFDFDTYSLDAPVWITNGVTLQRFTDETRSNGEPYMLYLATHKLFTIQQPQPEDTEGVVIKVIYNGYTYSVGDNITVIGGWSKISIEMKQDPTTVTFILNSCFASELPTFVTREGTIGVSTPDWFSMLGRYASTTPYEIAE